MSTKSKKTKRFKKGHLLLAVAALLGASYWMYMEEQGNFHCITPGQAYRSAQMDKDELEYYIPKHNIRSILNLRGENSDEPWYAEEIDVCQKYNVAHYDLALSARKEPLKNDVEQLLSIFNNAPRPILIHCKAGADRSGLAGAMWKVAIDGQSKKIAKKQLSILFGHIPFGQTAAMDNFFDKWYESR